MSSLLALLFIVLAPSARSLKCLEVMRPSTTNTLLDQDAESLLTTNSALAETQMQKDFMEQLAQSHKFISRVNDIGRCITSLKESEDRILELALESQRLLQDDDALSAVEASYEEAIYNERLVELFSESERSKHCLEAAKIDHEENAERNLETNERLKVTSGENHEVEANMKALDESVDFLHRLASLSQDILDTAVEEKPKQAVSLRMPRLRSSL